MRADYHCHSKYSDDSLELIENHIKQAIKIGLDEICLTDHVDYGVKKDFKDASLLELLIYKLTKKSSKINVDYPNYFKELDELKKKYTGKLTLKKGLELGVQTITLKENEELFNKYQNELDFVLLSIHQIDNQESWNQEYQQGKTQEEYNLGYYQELLNVVKNFKHYSCLAHLDLIVRYDKQGIYPFENYKHLVKEIFEVIIPEGKGIEINTSSWHYGLEDTTPSKEILKLYKEMGGRIITIGSDAHGCDRLGEHFDDAVKTLKEIGFEEICTFEGMKPIFHKI